MSDYSFLKTGFTTGSEVNKEPDEDLMLTVSAIVSSFVENSLKTAELYTNHSKRKVITTNDIKLCLMCETFQYLNKSDTAENIMKWKGIINDFQNESDDSDDLEDIVNNESDLKGDFMKSLCECEKCVTINSVEKYWNKWSPAEGIETILKKAIDLHFKV